MVFIFLFHLSLFWLIVSLQLSVHLAHHHHHKSSHFTIFIFFLFASIYTHTLSLEAVIL